MQARVAFLQGEEHGRNEAGEQTADRTEAERAFISGVVADVIAQAVILRDEFSCMGHQRAAGLVQDRRALGAIK